MEGRAYIDDPMMVLSVRTKAVNTNYRTEVLFAGRRYKGPSTSGDKADDTQESVRGRAKEACRL